MYLTADHLEGYNAPVTEHNDWIRSHLNYHRIQLAFKGSACFLLRETENTEQKYLLKALRFPLGHR